MPTKPRHLSHGDPSGTGLHSVAPFGASISRKRKILRVKQFHDTQRVTLNSSTIHRSTGQRPVFRPPSTGLNLMIQGLNYIHSPSDKTNVSILFLAWGSDYPLFPIPHGVPKQHGTCHMVILRVRGYIRSPHSGLLISRKRKILRVKQFHVTHHVILNSSTIHRSTGQRPVFRPPSIGLNLMIQGLKLHPFPFE